MATREPGYIRDQQHLLDYFTAAGMKRLVLRVSDVQQMSVDYQKELDKLIGQVARRAVGPSGIPYLVVDYEQLLDGRLSMVRLEILQAVLTEYRWRRLLNGDPVKVEPCKCGREGSTCQLCKGRGTICSYPELSDEELTIARE